MRYVLKDPKVILGNDFRVREWSPKNHSSFAISFKNRILSLCLVFKRIQKTKNIKIPKFVLFEIFKKVN